MPRIPDAFPRLAQSSLEDLQEMLEDPRARETFLGGLDEYRSFAAIWSSSATAAVEAARRNLDLEDALAAATADAGAAEHDAHRVREELLSALRRQCEVADRYSAPRLAREFERIASDLDRSTEALAQSIVSEDGGGERFGGGSVVGADGGGGSDAMSVVSGGGGSVLGGGGGALRGFREDYLEQRKAMHVARIKADILRTAGLA
jgi:hypothetical protein